MKFSQPLLVGTARRAGRGLWLAGLALCLGAFGIAAHAQAQGEAPGQVDPPGRVARLADLEGQVWLLSGDSGEWVNAVRNQPVTSGDRLATEAGARAELQVGSTTLRLDASTEIEVSRLDDDHLALSLLSGSASARLREAAEAGEFELSTDDGRFRTLRAGRYRFDRKDNASHLTVYEGQAVYEGQNSALTLNPGQHAEFWIDASNVAQYTMSGPYNDAFAAWTNERDRTLTAPGPAYQYVSPEMTGAQDLDRYGDWEHNTEYGALWTPHVVAADWAPYRAGHWAWVRPWGWTWVDDAPWGFAPFHYGRWVNYRNRWCWAPGQRVVRPVYAPALVAWVGGPNVNVSVRVGGRPGPAVGWFPLAPREVYVPGYRVSPRYVRNINITHVRSVTVINNAYRNPGAQRDFANRRHPNALTVVPEGVMTARQPVAPAASRWRDTAWARDVAGGQRAPQVMVTAPVAAPSIVRPADRSAIRPPPGFPTAGQSGPRPGMPGRRPPESAGVQQPQQQQQPGVNVTRPAVVQPGIVQPGGAGPGGDARIRPDRPSDRDDRRPGFVRPTTPNQPQIAVQPAPTSPPAVQRPALVTPTVPQPQIPTGALPGQSPGATSQRGNNPRDGMSQRPERVWRETGRDGEPRVVQQSNPQRPPQTAPVQQPAAVQAPVQPRVQQQPMPQPPAQGVQAPRAAEVQRPAAPEVRRPEAPRARAAEGRDDQRGDPRGDGRGR